MNRKTHREGGAPKLAAVTRPCSSLYDQPLRCVYLDYQLAQESYQLAGKLLASTGKLSAQESYQLAQDSYQLAMATKELVPRCQCSNKTNTCKTLTEGCCCRFTTGKNSYRTSQPHNELERLLWTRAGTQRQIQAQKKTLKHAKTQNQEQPVYSKKEEAQNCANCRGNDCG